MRSRPTLWFIILLTLFALFIDLPKLPISSPVNKIFGKFPLKLGLDLQGGTELVLKAQMDNIAPEDRDEALESARTVLERRVNMFGVSEALVQTSKVGEERRILVQLPGIKESSQAAALVGKTAQLEFKEMPLVFTPEELEATKSGVPLVAFAKPTGLTGADVKKATVTYGSGGANSGPQVSIEFNSEGSSKFAELTKRNINRQVPIFLDGIPISAPVVQQEIIGGNAVITGQFSIEEAKNLAISLNAGALRVPLTELSSFSIPPSLGKESVDKSLVAGAVGLTVVGIYMALFYGVWGLIADLALIIYALLVLAIFKSGLFIPQLQVTLTLPGVAGFILSVGMAVDANILIFERMKEEMRWGKSKQTALELGFKRAWSSIWASNVCSLLIAAILYYFGTSLVRGFAITLAIGVLVSMFSAYVVTRTILRYVIH